MPHARGPTSAAQALNETKERALSPMQRYAKKQAKTRQRCRLSTDRVTYAWWRCSCPPSLAASVSSTISMPSCAGKAIQAHHSRSPAAALVTRWASVAAHHRSCMVDLLWWYLGQTQPRLPWRVSCYPPMASTSHTARHPHHPSAPCLHRRHTGEAAPWLGGLRAHTAPAASRSASPQTGHSDVVRPASNGVYLVRHDVLLHPILRQEPHPLSYHQRHPLPGLP